MHITIDGRSDEEGRRRWTIAAAYHFCRRVVEMTQMVVVSGPHITAHRGVLHAVTMLEDGHVALQLNKHDGTAHVDLFGPEFEAPLVFDFARDCLELSYSKVRCDPRQVPDD